ncbi:MAG TPA: hypothetical protein VGZ90_04490 [Puia sp.]|jgi:hypothetical protein|nr:hypothetical protein [Puia sp.]
MAKIKNIISSDNSVIVDFEIDASTVFIAIKNSGVNAALHLKIKPSTAIFGLEGKKDLSKLNLFKEIKYMAPLKEIRIFVDGYDSFFRHLKNSMIDFTITWQDENKKSFKTKISHDLKIYSDLIFFIKKS